MKHEVKNYQEFVELRGKGEVLVDFYATWCGPCKMIAPIVDSIAKEFDDLTVLSVDVDEVPEAAGEYGVSGIPTLLYLQDGKLINTQVGYAPKPTLLKFIGR